MDQLALVEGCYFVGAVAENLGGLPTLIGFAHGRPIFQINPVGSISIDTDQQSNTLAPVTRSTMFGNAFDGSGEVLYTLPTPSTAQRLSISNSGGRANSLRVAAPTGSSIRFTDGNLYEAIVSSGNENDNCAFVGESNTIWRCIYAGEPDVSTWSPEA